MYFPLIHLYCGSISMVSKKRQQDNLPLSAVFLAVYELPNADPALNPPLAPATPPTARTPFVAAPVTQLYIPQAATGGHK
jgi:hypothetical protein